ncbi:MAG: UxaA family hydrolase [Tepidanaerobacteraceae bacterium]|nr:UxaA family hydrolase [Thermoanaerobacterales bacterium]
MENVLVLNEKDNVGNAIEDIVRNQAAIYSLAGKSYEIIAKEAIPFGFKIALKSINKGDSVIKYGEIIGIASKDITQGQLVHVHNLEGYRGRGDLNFKKRCCGT